MTFGDRTYVAVLVLRYRARTGASALVYGTEYVCVHLYVYVCTGTTVQSTSGLLILRLRYVQYRYSGTVEYVRRTVQCTA